MSFCSQGYAERALEHILNDEEWWLALKMVGVEDAKIDVVFMRSYGSPGTINSVDGIEQKFARVIKPVLQSNGNTARCWASLGYILSPCPWCPWCTAVSSRY